jgi:hypothetical protein
MFRRLIVIVFGFLIATGVGGIFLPIAAFFDPVTREAGFDATMAGYFAIVDELMRDGSPEIAVSAVGFVFWAVFIGVCVAPLAIAALIGEVARVSAWTWYAGASAFLAAASPWIARASRGLENAQRASPLEARFALLFFLTGVVTGTVYLRGRSLARQRSAAYSFLLLRHFYPNTGSHFSDMTLSATCRPVRRATQPW